MSIFQHTLWGYALTYPDDWVHHSLGNKDQATPVEGFAARPEALDPDYRGEQSGHLLVHAEWNGSRQDIEPLWNQHIGLTAGMLGAKKVGAAPWHMGGAAGMEAEIVLPKNSNLRLWAGILERGYTVLHLMVSHPKEERAWFEPLVTKLIASLSFPATVGELPADSSGLPLPPGYTPVPPASIISDIADPGSWAAYHGNSPIGALQAFYLREAPAHGWEIEGFDAFPASTQLGFARFQLQKGDAFVTLGLMPYGNERVTNTSAANIVLKYKPKNLFQ